MCHSEKDVVYEKGVTDIKFLPISDMPILSKHLISECNINRYRYMHCIIWFSLSGEKRLNSVHQLVTICMHDCYLESCRRCVGSNKIIKVWVYFQQQTHEPLRSRCDEEVSVALGSGNVISRKHLPCGECCG